MLCEGSFELSCGNIPQPYLSPIATCERGTIRIERYSYTPARMSSEGGFYLSRARIPQPYRVVAPTSPTCERVAIRTEC